MYIWQRTDLREVSHPTTTNGYEKVSPLAQVQVASGFVSFYSLQLPKKIKSNKLYSKVLRKNLTGKSWGDASSSRVLGRRPGFSLQNPYKGGGAAGCGGKHLKSQCWRGRDNGPSGSLTS